LQGLPPVNFHFGRFLPLRRIISCSTADTVPLAFFQPEDVYGCDWDLDVLQGEE